MGRKTPTMIEGERVRGHVTDEGDRTRSHVDSAVESARAAVVEQGSATRSHVIGKLSQESKATGDAIDALGDRIAEHSEARHEGTLSAIDELLGKVRGALDTIHRVGTRGVEGWETADRKIDRLAEAAEKSAFTPVWVALVFALGCAIGHFATVLL